MSTPDDPYDDALFDDDARFARAHLSAADPAAVPPSAAARADARDQLAWRLAPAAATAAGVGPVSASPTSGSMPRSGSLSTSPPEPLPAGAMVTALPVRRRPSRWLAVPVAAVVALVVGLLVLQPFSPDTPAGAQVLRAAAQTTEAQGTARVSATIEGLGQTVSAEGVGDLSNGDGRLTVHAPEPVGDVEVIHDGNDIYASVPALLGDQLGGATWLHADAATLTNLADLAGRSGMAGFDLSFALDPVTAVDYVRSVSGEVTEVGPETIQGEATTHFSTHLDPAKLADQLGEADRDALDRAVMAANQQIPVDLWIDDAGRLRKLTVRADLDKVQVPEGTNTGGTTLTGPVTATFELSDFGAKVDTTPPPADQVTEVGPLLGMLARAGGR